MSTSVKTMLESIEDKSNYDTYGGWFSGINGVNQGKKYLTSNISTKRIPNRANYLIYKENDVFYRRADYIRHYIQVENETITTLKRDL